MSVNAKEIAQQAFNKVYTHLVTQGVQARDDRGICRYRVKYPDGVRRCSIGCFIDDNTYHANIEGKSVRHLHKEGFPLFPYSHLVLELLEDLQDLHDCGEVTVERRTERGLWNWQHGIEYGLNLIAMKHGLTLPDKAGQHPPIKTAQEQADVI